jgi:hypothetical protein
MEQEREPSEDVANGQEEMENSRKEEKKKKRKRETTGETEGKQETGANVEVTKGGQNEIIIVRIIILIITIIPVILDLRIRLRRAAGVFESGARPVGSL